jgi:hypothetical protein
MLNVFQHPACPTSFTPGAGGILKQVQDDGCVQGLRSIA